MTAHPDRPPRAVLDLTALHPSLQEPALESMNFLNEITGRYPDAISFAPGRPHEEFFAVEDIHAHLDRYTAYLREARGMSEAQVRRTLFQYGPTKGIIPELVARNLAVDEGITADPESVVITTGCQEAMFLVLRALRAGEKDAALAVTPGYVGLTGAATLAGMPVLPVAAGPSGIDPDDLRSTVHAARRKGLRPRACYLVPDFSNPSGTSLDEPARHHLLDLAEQEDLLLLEDNPYGLFHDGGPRPPTLKALDTRGRVIYLGSFAKTGLPGARVGYAVADQPVRDGRSGATTLLADELAKLKSMLTVNTSPIAQAVIGGKLLAHGCSLVKANERETEVYRRNRAHLINGLTRRFPPDTAPSITWNTPAGGFFLVVDVPFPADDALLETSARRHGVLWTPMRHFSASGADSHRIRLSCSLLTPEQIEEGLNRFTRLVQEQRTECR